MNNADPDDDHDERQKWRDNLVLLAGFLALVGAGVWMLVTMADVRKAQDCAAQGRRNCATFDAPDRTR